MAIITLVCACASVACFGQGPSVQYQDRAYDALPRPTDVVGSTPFDLGAHRPPELISIRVGRWNPTQAAMDLFVGVFSGNGGFLRLDLTLDGVINPPGSIAPGAFDPFRYGPNPVYGFVEIDVDDDKETGGETYAPQYRYLANAARFGGLPDDGAFDDRLARRASDLDGDFTTAPFVERHGEEFHWALLGGQFLDLDVDERVGDGDLIFDSGEDWRIGCDWFHRAHGFEPYSLVYGGGVSGEYPVFSVARFAHDPNANWTVVSLVVPLTNTAAAMMRGWPDEPFDLDASNLTSIGEGLDDLEESAELVVHFPTGEPEEVLIVGWREQEWYHFIDPTEWRLTALLGTTYTAPGAYFIWTDLYPDAARGDVDGENGPCGLDRSDIESYISDYDGADGIFDGAVTLDAFAENFDVFDVGHDGVVDGFDILLVSPPGDVNDDDDVDLEDLAIWQQCQGLQPGAPPCWLTDVDRDGDTDYHDLNWFVAAFSGPQP